MLEYDYVIERNEEDEQATYVPDKIPKKLPSLVYIEGPNSSGKSTLLNIIALGLYGLKKATMAPALKDKMNSLLDTSYQEITFQFKIQNKDKSLEIISEKKDPKKPAKVYEVKNGKKISLPRDRFEREYNLIYDIPDNPTQRLNQLADSIKDLQQIRYNMIVSLRSQIQLVISHVKSSRDPVQIKKLKKKLVKDKKDYEDLLNDNKKNVDFLDLLEKYTYCRFLKEYLDKLTEVEKELKKLKNEKKKAKRKITTKNKEYRRLNNAALEDLNFIKESFYKILPTLKKLFIKEYRNLIMVLDRINFDVIYNKLEIPDGFKKVLMKFQTELYDIKEDKKYKEPIEEARIWEKIIGILEEYETSDIIVPVLNKKISEFINILKKANEKNEELIEYINIIEFLINLIEEINVRCRKLETDIFPQLIEMKGSGEYELVEDQLSIEDEIEQVEQRKREITENCDHYIKKCTKKDISEEDFSKIYDDLIFKEELSSFLLYSETQLIEKINLLKKQIKEDESSLERKKSYIKTQKDEIDRLEKKEPHKYQDKFKELEAILRICMNLEQKFVKYNRYIIKIINKRGSRIEDAEQKKYYEEVSKYLGKRIGYIKYIDKNYTIKSIDILNEKITTEEGKIIRFADMGTGQSQSAYLIGQLNVSDDRKIFALFDEVAMMDRKSLKPVFNKLRELYENDKLLLGIIVQKGEEIECTDLGK